jgi:hypothetical protein
MHGTADRIFPFAHGEATAMPAELRDEMVDRIAKLASAS